MLLANTRVWERHELVLPHGLQRKPMLPASPPGPLSVTQLVAVSDSSGKLLSPVTTVTLKPFPASRHSTSTVVDQAAILHSVFSAGTMLRKGLSDTGGEAKNLEIF